MGRAMVPTLCNLLHTVAMTAKQPSWNALREAYVRSVSTESHNEKTTISIETNISFTTHQCEPLSRIVETNPVELMKFYVHDEGNGDRHGFPLKIEADKGFLSSLQRAGDCLHGYGGFHHEERLHYHDLQRPFPLFWSWRDSV